MQCILNPRANNLIREQQQAFEQIKQEIVHVVALAPVQAR